MFDERARGSLRGIRGPLAVLVVLAMMLQTAGQAYAAGTLDQSQPSVNPSNGTAFVLTQEPLLITAQTFTAGLTGNLDQVGLAIAHAGRTASNANIEIRTVSGGVPTSTVIGSGTVLAANVPQATIGVGISMLLAPLATPAPVVAGTQYAIVLRGGVSGSQIIWDGTTVNAYAGGQGMFTANGGTTWTPLPFGGFTASDLAFQTYVTRPTLSVGSAQVVEGNSGTTNLDFPVSLSPTVGATVTATYTLADGTATGGAACTAGVDFINTAGVVTVPANGTTGTITVPVCGETLVEPDETLTVTLGTPTNAVLGTATATGTIQNDDATSLSISDVQVVEGNSGTTNATFTVTLSNPSAQTVTVQFATADGTATVADGDYQGASGTLTFAPGDTSKTITVLVNGDTKIEPNEAFVVNLSSPINATIADTQGAGTILNDDAPVSITKTGPAGVTPGSNVAYTLTITNTGTVPAADVSVADPAPPGLTFVSNSGACATAFPCALGTLAAGASRTITATFAVPTGYSGPSPIQNTATVTVAGANPASAVASTTVTAAPVVPAPVTLAPVVVAPVTLAPVVAAPVVAVVNDPNNDDEEDEAPRETEEQRQQRQHTNAGNRGDVATEGNVIAVERPDGANYLLVTIAMTRNETLVVQVPCDGVDRCPDVRVGDYLEADGYQNGVGDPNAYFVASEGVEVTRNGKKVK